MSRASNTLTVSDVITTPIKLKYSSSYDETSYYSAGIRVLSGYNDPIDKDQRIPQTTLNYVSARHLFYSNYLTGSIFQSASYAVNWEQSTAASGTFDDDRRHLPTGSGEGIKILSIPRSIYGQKISRHGFQLVSKDGVSFNLVDDGNGNVTDYSAYSDDRYVTKFGNLGDEDQYTVVPQEDPLVGYLKGPEKRGSGAGNIIYSQGIVIITDPYYVNALDSGPVVVDHVYTFYDTDNPKDFDPLVGAVANSSPIDTATLTLTPAPGQTFPNYTIAGSTVTLDPLDPLYTTVGSYSINYSVSSQIGTPSNTGHIIVNIVPDCAFSFIVSTYYSYGSPKILFDFDKRDNYANNMGAGVKDLTPNNNDGIFTRGNKYGTPYFVVGYDNGNPAYQQLPGGATKDYQLAVRIPDYFKYNGTANYTFAVWIRIDSYRSGTAPGIVSSEGRTGAVTPTGWYWRYTNTVISAGRTPGIGAGSWINVPWSTLTSGASSTVPLGKWMFLHVRYDGSRLYTGGIINDVFYEDSTVSTHNVVSSLDYAPYMGLSFNQWAAASFGYMVGYDTALTPAELFTIYGATKYRY